MPRNSRKIFLFDGCYCTEPKVTPSNWNLTGASTNKTWQIWYRFYDPSIINAKGEPKPKLVTVKGMNDFKTLLDRREATKALLRDTFELLTVDGFNPITNKIRPKVEILDGLGPHTPFATALPLALKNLEAAPHTKEDIRSTIKYTLIALAKLKIDMLPVGDVQRKHIKLLLQLLSELKTRWTNNTYNAYRKNLRILFEQMLEVDAVEDNPVTVKKRKHAPAKREILTEEQCKEIERYIKNYDTRFWVLINAFFASGARTTEIVRVKGEHVNLDRQTIKYLVLKGRNYQWVTRPIPDAALEYWRYALEGCAKKDFVFSKGLKPGPHAIRSEQLSRRWKRHVKNKLGISSDWYALKHLNSTKNVDAVLEEIREAQAVAALQTAHKSSKMIVDVYDIKSKERLSDALKKRSKTFAS